MRSTLSLFAIVVASACSCDAAQGTDGGARTDGGGQLDGGARDASSDAQSSLCPGSGARFVGTTFAPNGTDPIPNVLVYATEDTHVFEGPWTSVRCVACVSTPPGALASTRSGADGSFVLASPTLDAGGTFTVVVESGGFRRVVRGVTIDECGTVTLAAAQTTLPGANAGDDTIPPIAVASSTTGTGDVNDDFAFVLDAMGITGYDRVHPDRSGTPSAAGLFSLLSDTSRLMRYQIVIVPCGALGNFSVDPNLTPQIVSNLRAWLAAGGRLYASDLAYAVVQRSYPEAVTFAPGPSPRAGTDPATVGVGIARGSTIPGRIDAPELLAWLQLVGAAPAGATEIPIADLRDPWSAVDFVAPELLAPDAMGLTHAVVWVSADVDWHIAGSGRHPLTVQADYAGPAGDYCGRVVFTSYHVETGTGTLTPQERVLEYLFFQLSSCIPTLI